MLQSRLVHLTSCGDALSIVNATFVDPGLRGRIRWRIAAIATMHTSSGLSVFVRRECTMGHGLAKRFAKVGGEPGSKTVREGLANGL